jgi:hypothetical protein
MTEFLDEGPAVDRGPIASSMIEAAQKAVGDGDYAEAERLLRQAAAIQEATLGSHPEFATTVNNLAFVCERLNKFDEAERGYRRAHAIAVASLTPGHPLIKTSLSNLVEFCEARGIPLWTPPAASPEEKPPPDDVEVKPTVSDMTADVVREPVAAGRLGLRMVAVAAVVVVAIVMVLLAAGPKGPALPENAKRPALPEDAKGPAVPEERTTDVRPSVSSARTETVPPPVAPAPSKAPAPVPPPAPEPTVVPKPRQEPASANANAPVSVLKAQLCSALDRRGMPDWQCTAASGELPPGRYLFYTRLLAQADTTVEHRWLRGGRVHQAVRLRVTPNPGNGYRTFSGTTISPERAGEWKIELRTVDGTLLEQTSFVVR